MATGYQSIPRTSDLRDPSTVEHCEACGEPGAFGVTLSQSDALATDDGQMAVTCLACHVLATLIGRAVAASFATPLDGGPLSINESEPLAN